MTPGNLLVFILSREEEFTLLKKSYPQAKVNIFIESNNSKIVDKD